jgi:glucose/arabinose dehydrogenase
MRAFRLLVLAAAAASLAALAPARPAFAEDASVQFQDAWPGVSFDKPTAVAWPADGTDRLFVVQRGGKVVVLRKYRGVDPVPQPRTFLDLSSLFPADLLDSSQAGLVNLAFHPDFRSNGRFFVFYGTGNPPRAEVVEFRGRGDQADPASRRLLLTVPKKGNAHYGGGLAFGPDRMLYVGLGDSGTKNDPETMGQDLRTLQSKILRIDVDRAPAAGGGGRGAAAYAIPADNPFVTAPAGARGEIWAYGVRNPFRFSFDRQTGALWLGDPGQQGMEEVSVVPKGGNMGWPAKEGTKDVRPVPGLDPRSLVPPVFEYARDVGKASIGGVVYRGQRCPTLAGNYVFSDYMSGKLFALTLDASGRRVTGDRLLAGVQNISSIDQDAQGELYFCQLDDGHVLTVVPR